MTDEARGVYLSSRMVGVERRVRSTVRLELLLGRLAVTARRPAVKVDANDVPPCARSHGERR